MERLHRLVTRFHARRLAPRRRDGEGEGVTVVEYSLLAALIAGVGIIAVTALGRQIA